MKRALPQHPTVQKWRHIGGHAVRVHILAEQTFDRKYIIYRTTMKPRTHVNQAVILLPPRCTKR